MAKVIQLNNITRLDLPPDRIMENTIGKLQGVVILGYTNEGEEWFASSYADGGTVLWLMERAKKALIEIDCVAS